MKNTLITIGVIAFFLLILYFIFGGTYNSMVTKSQDTQAKWGMVQSQYQRRMDLYSSVIATVKNEAKFEQSTLEAVIKARASATQITVDPTKLTPESIAAFQQAQNNMSSSFGRLLAVAENYPQLQTNQAFQGFQAQIEGTENRINKSRDDFNASVQDYNTYIKRFPNNFIASMFSFTEKGYFKAAENAQQNPNVDSLYNK
jgi:LemA protein